MARLQNRGFNAISQFFDDVGRARRMANTYHQLSMLSDGELSRRGLKRSDIANEAARRCGF